ncbi:MAG: DUF4492 domain-containing protein [Bacteroidales bacterium]|nr:DUF4492 domain-containing protein [Bacteroidales bacterium]
MKSKPFSQILRFYYTGFRDMPKWGRTLWLIILLKLFFLFAILRIFFMPDLLKKNFTSDNERAGYVLEQLTE